MHDDGVGRTRIHLKEVGRAVDNSAGKRGIAGLRGRRYRTVNGANAICLSQMTARLPPFSLTSTNSHES
jgi:hypothetical protein